MTAVLDFAWAILSDFYAVCSASVSIVSMVIAFLHPSSVVPPWTLWMVGYAAMLVAAWRVWYREYRKPGPLVELETTKERNQFPELVLYNSGDETAFEVKIQNIVRGQEGTASFEWLNLKAGDRAFIKPTIQRTPKTSKAFSNQLPDFILNTRPPGTLEDAFMPEHVAFYVDYMSVHGQHYLSKFIVSFRIMDEIKVRFISRRREFSPVYPFSKVLSKRS